MIDLCMLKPGKTFGGVAQKNCNGYYSLGQITGWANPNQPQTTTPPIQLLMVTLRTCPYEDRKWTESCCYAAGRYGLALSKKINNMNKHIENKVIKHRF